MKIGVVGLWHLGEVAAVALADLGHTVIGVDENRETIENLRKGIPPLEEPGVRERIERHLRGGTLFFTDEFKNLADCEGIFFTFDTPVTDADESNTDILFATAKKIAPFLRTQILFVVMSQVPVGTTKKLASIIAGENHARQCESVYFPENLQLGKALECFFDADRFVIGADTPAGHERMGAILEKSRSPRLHMNIASAELSKHALNGYLATSLSFIYNIADLCEAYGADITEVARALRSDSRIGPAAYLDASIGFSGGTLMRDVKMLMRLSKAAGTAVSVIDGAAVTNETRRRRMADRIERLLNRSLRGARVGILGVTYKPGTATLRRSMALEMAYFLKERGAEISAHDPQADHQELTAALGTSPCATPYEMASGCHAVLLLTAWPEFAAIDFSLLKEKMEPPHLFFDTRNFLREREEELIRLGFLYKGIGRG